jgi:two-component sensor histidine kinase
LSKSIGNLFPQSQGLSGALDWSQTNRPVTVNRADDNLLMVLPGAASSGGFSFGAGSVQTLTPDDGLAIVKEAADLHHAEIRIETPEGGVGTRITVRFPDLPAAA